MPLVLFVLSNPEKLEDVLSAWEAAGASGATILASTGLGRLRRNSLLCDDFPLIPSLEDLFRREETSSRTIFTLVEEEATLDEIVARGFDGATVERVQRLLYGSEYKRRQAAPGQLDHRVRGSLSAWVQDQGR